VHLRVHGLGGCVCVCVCVCALMKILTHAACMRLQFHTFNTHVYILTVFGPIAHMYIKSFYM